MFRTIGVQFLLFLDSVVVSWKLRLLPERFAQMGGEGKKRKGVLRILAGLMGLLILLLDYMRHALILYASETTTVVGISAVNPITKNKLRITNHQLADIFYATSMVFTGSNVFHVIKTPIGAETVLVNTNFIME